MISEATPAEGSLTGLVLWLAILSLCASAPAWPNQASTEILAGRPMVVSTARPSQESPSQPLLTPPPASLPGSTASTETGESDPSLDMPCLHGAGASSEQELPLVSTDSACEEAFTSPHHGGFRFGSRMRTQNRMLGDFDGVMLDYGFGNFALNGIAGFPVSGSKGINPKNQLYGVSAGVRKLPKGWDVNGYMMELHSADQSESSAMGGAIRYTHNNRSLLISADYDLLTHTLSRLMVSSAWKLRPSSTLSTTIDLRQSRLPPGQNSYLQQTIAMTEGWKWGLPFDRIRDLSSRESTDVAAFGFSLSHRFARDIRLSSDLAVLNVSQEESSDNLSTSISEFNEYYFNLKLSAKSLALAGDNSTWTLRGYVSDTSRLSSSSMDLSYPFSHQWLLAPRLKIDYQDNLQENSTQWVASPALKLEYRWRKQSKIKFTAAGEWRKHQNATDVAVDSSYVVSLGYQTAF